MHKKQHWWFIFFAPHHLKEDAESKHNLPLAAVDEITSLFGNRTTHRVLHTYIGRYIELPGHFFNEMGEITIKQTAELFGKEANNAATRPDVDPIWGCSLPILE